MNEEQTLAVEELGKVETIKVYNQAYVDKQQKRTAELETQIEKVKHYLDYDIPHDLINEATTKIYRMLK